MKPLRFLLIALGSLVLLVAMAIALALNPAVQTWVAHCFAPATPELSIALDHIDAGLHRTQVNNLRVVQPGLLLTVPSAEIEVNAIDATGGKIEVHRLVAKGWLLDLTVPVAAGSPRTTAKDTLAPAPATPAKPAVAPTTPQLPPEQRARAAVNGLFARLRLPIDLAVDGVDLAGDVILPEGRIHLVITGGGLTSEQEGKWALAADFTGPEATAVSVQGNFTARLATPRSFDHFGLALTAVAKGPKVPRDTNLALTLTAACVAQSETYAAVLCTGQRQLLQVELALPFGTAPLTGSWKLDVATADASPFALGRALPDFFAKGQGNFSADRSLTQVSAAGSLVASGDKLGQLRPELSALGRLGFVADFDLASQEQVVRLKRGDLRLTAGDKPVVTVSTLQPIAFNRSTGALVASEGLADLMRIVIDGIPLAWVQPFLGERVLTGQDLSGAFTLSARNGGVSLRPAAPLTILNVSVAQAGHPLVSGLDVSLSAQADYSPQGWAAEISQLAVTQAGAPLLKLTAKAAQATGPQQPLAASGTYEVALPALLAQPIASGTVALARGAARGDFSASVATMKTASFTLQLADLIVANPAATRLPAVVLLARADVDTAGRINAQLPLVITQNGRRSDLTLSSIVNSSTGATALKAEVTAGTLHLNDLLSFAALTPSSPTRTSPPANTSNPAPAMGEPAETSASTASPPATANPTNSLRPAPAPLWAGVGGELKIDIKNLVYSPDLQITGINGVVKLNPAALTLDGLHAALSSGGHFDATGELQFDTQQAPSYALKADVTLADLDSAPLLRALSPGRPSPIMGKFNLATRLAGRATSPGAFGDTVIGDIALSSQSGTLRVLSVKAGANADTVGTVAAMAGLFGALTGSEETVKKAEQVRAAAVVAKQLSAITYSQFNVVVGRDAQRNLAVKELTITSPQLRLAGSGQIIHQPGVPLVQQPLLLNLKLGAREPLVSSLRTLKLVDGSPDAQGYTALLDDVTLDGSLQAIGTGQLQRLMDRAMSE